MVRAKSEAENRVREVRESEGLSRAALALQAGLADRTLKRLESGAPVAGATKGKVLKALNRLPDRLRNYKAEDVFPSDSLLGGKHGE